MRFVARLIGTWLLALAVVLIVVDGTRSLAANAFEFTPLATSWLSLHEPSLTAARQFLDTRFLGPVLREAFEVLIGWPGWAVFGVPALLLVFAGRSRADQLRQFTQF